MSPEITIITPTFNRWDLLEKLGKSLKKFSMGVPYEWLIIENGMDGSAQHAREEFNDREGCSVSIIQGDNRWSFARQNNQAAKCAEGKYLFFINNDVQLLTPLTLATAYLDHDSVGAVGGILFFPDGRLQHAGVIMQENAAPANLGMRAISKLDLDPAKVDPAKWPVDAIPVAAVTGALLACTKKSFDEVGGFDESFPWGFEDVDFCLRLLDRLGRASYVSRNLAGLHAESSSGSRADIDLGLLVFRGRWGYRVHADYQRFQKYEAPTDNPKIRKLVRVLKPKDAQEAGLAVAAGTPDRSGA